MADRLEVAGGSGGAHTFKETLWGAKDQRLEPFLAFRTRYDQALEQLRAAPGADETALLCWGGTPRDPLKTGTSFTTRTSGDAPKQPDPDKNEVRLTERLRIVEKIKVTAADDKEVFVVVERMRAWLADGNDGKRYVLMFNPTGQKIVVAEGAAVTVG